ncbi:MAG: DUF2806 domain-containing protein [Myxococcales bacterium]|nr:DUF2806 domain-containing protein [Myxococcales bacterium]
MYGGQCPSPPPPRNDHPRQAPQLEPEVRHYVSVRDTEPQGHSRRGIVVVGRRGQPAGSGSSRSAAKPAPKVFFQRWGRSARFFSSAQDVSTAELQKLWGRSLPERSSVRVPSRSELFELLRNMTKAEADLLLKVGSRVASNSVYLPYGSLDLSTTERLLAQDAGFLPFNRSRIVWKADVGASVENQAIPQPPSARGIARVPYPRATCLSFARTTQYSRLTRTSFAQAAGRGTWYTRRRRGTRHPGARCALRRRRRGRRIARGHRHHRRPERRHGGDVAPWRHA